MNHFGRFALLAVLGFSTSIISGGEIKVGASHETIEGPAPGVDAAKWLSDMKAWRREKLAKMRYDGSRYARPELRWTQRSFMQPLMMVEDRYFYDPVAGQYTVDRYLDDLERRYGGIDSILPWPVYPNIGIDNRNQHDLLHDMPGGLAGLKRMVADFHRRGVRVLFPAMPWDTGTRPEGVSLAEAAVRDMKAIGADGINGDTFLGIGRGFADAADAALYPLVLEPECRMKDEAMLAWNTMSWGYWDSRPAPVVSLYKWLEPRHMVNVCDRWARDRRDRLQAAFFNGVGYETWENVWGIWNQLTPRDAEIVRRIAAIERAMAELLTSPDWEPHTPTLQRDAGIYASRFPGAGQTLWTLVNRTAKESTGPQLKVAVRPGTKFFDLWHGAELKTAAEGADVVLSFEIEPGGFGAVLAIEGETPPDAVTKLLPKMADLSKKRLSEFSSEWKALPQRIVEIPCTKPVAEAPEGMVSIPGGKFRFRVSGVEIEGEDEPGVDFQYPWEELPRRHHDKELNIDAFFIDRTPVTNAQFKKFLEATAYRPQDDHNFLKDWIGGSYPQGWEKKPVTWVSLEDARAYAAWAGKRLPHEWEWQYAAQGTDGRKYPWGTKPDPNAIPHFESGRELRGPTEVDRYPAGASPFGVLDLVSNVWQWTDEYLDEHTRAAVLRGGSYYRPSGSGWYFPQNTRLDQHAKYLLLAPSKDRSATVGFRCVVDRQAEK